jgi:hypothetical protein
MGTFSQDLFLELRVKCELSIDLLEQLGPRREGAIAKFLGFLDNALTSV